MVEFKINKHTWRLYIVSPEDLSIKGVHGYTDFAKHNIQINSDLDETEIRSTITHEITHAYRWSYGFVNDAENLKYAADEVEEMMANFIESFGDEIIEISKELYKLIKKEIKLTKKSKKK